MLLSVKITEVQHIQEMSFDINLAEHKLNCIVGKNGVGKTTLIKAIRNLSFADTFSKTSSNNIFYEKSTIMYNIAGEEFAFYYDRDIGSLNCKAVIPESIKSMIIVELPIPYGERFNYFQTISDADLEIRRAVVLENFNTPNELIDFLNDIYTSSKFDNLVEIQIKGNTYYCVLLDDSRYVREDYLSSGEYFLVSLYRKIKGGCKLIVIDEIDISLDAAAQAHLVRKLRELCDQYSVTIMFTTHSLAMMRTLDVSELFYMQECERGVEIISASYNYIKSLLFGFSGWDKYILTEDFVLQKFLDFIIKKYCDDVYYEYKIIYVGGGANVVDLMLRNSQEEFLSESKHVIAVLDGDQKDFRHARRESTYCVPIDSVEKALFNDYQESDFIPRLEDSLEVDPKKLYKGLIKEGLMSEMQIFAYLCDKNSAVIEEFSGILRAFLSRPN